MGKTTLQLEPHSNWRDEIFDLKKVIEKWTSCKVTLDQLFFEQVPSNIVRVLGGRGRKKDTSSSKEVVFSKASESLSETIPNIHSDYKSECDNLEPLPPLPKLTWVEPTATSSSVLTLADLTQTPVVPKETKKVPEKGTSINVIQPPCYSASKVKGLKEQIKIPLDSSPSISQSGSFKSAKGKQRTWFGPCSSSRKAPMIPKPFIDCKYCGFNDHHFDECEYYPGCDICGSIAHETSDCTKKPSNNTKPRIGYTKPKNLPLNPLKSLKVVFRDNSLGDTEGYGSVNCNGIIFTRVSYVNEEEMSMLLTCHPIMKKAMHVSLPKHPTVLTGSSIRDYPTSTSKTSTNLQGKTLGISPDISYFYVFNYHVHIHNHMDHLGKFDAKADDEFLAGVTTRSKIRDSKAVLAHECLYVNFLSKIEPKKLIKALEEEGWIIAMQEELNHFEGNKVWTLGYNQQEGIDYDETFSPVPRHEAIRIFLAYAAYMGFVVFQMDVKSTFLNGKISEEIYVDDHFAKLMTKKYEMDLLKKYDLADSALVKCLMLPPNNLGPDESRVSVNETLFRGMIESLMYLTTSIPDIQFSTCLYARYQANPKESYLVAVKRIFRKSTSGGCQILGGKLVCWSTKKQSSVAMSSAEAEYVAAAGCCAQFL
ncbi:retrovirus-related pol polyprotein from transposon TNT 1-94 [Tanacetum coccineum]